MKPERILLPIDVARCPLEVFEVVNGFSSRPDVTVILLHVLNLERVAPQTVVDDEFGRKARRYLQQLADEHLPPIASTITHVRKGRPAEQIVAEAKAESVDLIILPTYGPSLWNRLKAFWRAAPAPIVSPLAEQVIREAACGVFFVSARTRLNCERVWGRPVKEGAVLSQETSREFSSTQEPAG